jgi:two-component system OmpR family response regulator
VKILLVDDDVALVAAVRRGLTAEGFTVEVAADGVEGLWRAQEGRYDAILLDVMLPGRNGYTVCADLRRGGSTTPILMLTAKDRPLDEAEGLDTGADDYLTKPFSFTVLVSRIHALIRRASMSQPSPMAVGDLQVNPRTRRVTRAGVDHALTAREIDLLSYLVRRTGDVVSKLEILDAVWDDGFDGAPNVVEVYIARLRRKVDEPFAGRLIETVRGAGYRVLRP